NCRELERVTDIIMNILGGRKLEEDREYLRELIRALRRRGAETVVLGCTELPLLLDAPDGVIDTLDVLAEATVELAVTGMTVDI
ncbi:MAG: aspartate/glutamate racemase family protein, partial [Halobacteriaceae archaeon]